MTSQTIALKKIKELCALTFCVLVLSGCSKSDDNPKGTVSAPAPAQSNKLLGSWQAISVTTKENKTMDANEDGIVIMSGDEVIFITEFQSKTMMTKFISDDPTWEGTFKISDYTLDGTTINWKINLSDGRKVNQEPITITELNDEYLTLVAERETIRFKRLKAWAVDPEPTPMPVTTTEPQKPSQLKIESLKEFLGPKLSKLMVDHTCQNKTEKGDYARSPYLTAILVNTDSTLFHMWEKNYRLYFTESFGLRYVKILSRRDFKWSQPVAKNGYVYTKRDDGKACNPLIGPLPDEITIATLDYPIWTLENNVLTVDRSEISVINGAEGSNKFAIKKEGSKFFLISDELDAMNKNRSYKEQVEFNLETEDVYVNDMIYCKFLPDCNQK